MDFSSLLNDPNIKKALLMGGLQTMANSGKSDNLISNVAGGLMTGANTYYKSKDDQTERSIQERKDNLQMDVQRQRLEQIQAQQAEANRQAQLDEVRRVKYQDVYQKAISGELSREGAQKALADPSLAINPQLQNQFLDGIYGRQQAPVKLDVNEIGGNVVVTNPITGKSELSYQGASKREAPKIVPPERALDMNAETGELAYPEAAAKVKAEQQKVIDEESRQGLEDVLSRKSMLIKARDILANKNNLRSMTGPITGMLKTVSPDTQLVEQVLGKEFIDSVLANIKGMGQISDKDMEVLQSSVPNKYSDENIIIDYFNRVIAGLESSEEKYRGQMSSTGTPPTGIKTINSEEKDELTRLGEKYGYI